MIPAAAGFGRGGARGRLTSAVLAATVHIAALVLVLLVRSEPVAAPARNFATITVSTASPAEEAPAKPLQPREVPPVPPEPLVIPPPLIELPRLPDLVVLMLAQADAQSAGGACDLTEPVQAALRLSPDVQRELPTIPQRRRSVANVVALWNQTWVVADADLGENVLNSVRTVVAATIAAASDTCRLQTQGGPRLIYLPGEADTVLAFGSGEWTWQQVADSALEQPLEAGEPNPFSESIAANSIHSGRRSVSDPGQERERN